MIDPMLVATRETQGQPIDARDRMEAVDPGSGAPPVYVERQALSAPTDRVKALAEALRLTDEIANFVRERVADIQRNFRERSSNRIEAEALLARMESSLATGQGGRAGEPPAPDALAALKEAWEFVKTQGRTGYTQAGMEKAIAALETALAAPALDGEREPDAWQWKTTDTWYTVSENVADPETYARKMAGGFGKYRPIYTQPLSPTKQAEGWDQTQQRLEQLAMAAAVASVDAVHGYTMEFAPSPANHRCEYDMAEIAIYRELERVLLAASPSPAGDSASSGGAK